MSHKSKESKEHSKPNPGFECSIALTVPKLSFNDRECSNCSFACCHSYQYRLCNNFDITAGRPNLRSLLAIPTKAQDIPSRNCFCWELQQIHNCRNCPGNLLARLVTPTQIVATCWRWKLRL